MPAHDKKNCNEAIDGDFDSLLLSAVRNEQSLIRRMRSTSICEVDDSEVTPEKGTAPYSSASQRKRTKKKHEQHTKNDKETPQAPLDESPRSILRYTSNRSRSDNKNEKVHSVQFGNAHFREMKRSISADTVPTDSAGFPLGLSDEIVQEYVRTVQEHEQFKQQQFQHLLL